MIRKSSRLPGAVSCLCALLLTVVCVEANPVSDRIKSKAESAKAGVQELHRSGAPPVDLVGQLRRIPKLMQAGRIEEAETILDEVLAEVERRKSGGGAEAGNVFCNPRAVSIDGYDDDVMEPFISRDGSLLLFNNSNDPNVDTNLHLARVKGPFEFEYVGPIEGANSKALDGVPSLDENGRLVFISTRSYDMDRKTLYAGQLEGRRATQVAPLRGSLARGRPPWFNMDAELAPDGEVLYYVENEFDPAKGRPKSSNILVARLRDGRYVEDPDGRRIMRNVNTDELEYAPAISADGLALFFTRAEGIVVGNRAGASGTFIYVATRQHVDDPFGAPVRLRAIRGFVEGPTVTSDGKRLYYHARIDGKFVLHAVERCQ